MHAKQRARAELSTVAEYAAQWEPQAPAVKKEPESKV
jgi:hypothetical protein